MKITEFGKKLRRKWKERTSGPITAERIPGQNGEGVLSLGAWRIPVQTRQVLRVVGGMVLSFFLARVRLAGGCYPLGIAFFCAASAFAPLYAAAAFTGACTVGTADSLLCGAVTVTTLLLRVMVGKWIDAEGELIQDGTENGGGIGNGKEKSLLRILLPQGLFSEGRWYRVGAAAIGGAIGGVMLLIMENFSAGAVVGAIGYAVGAALYCRGFTGLFVPRSGTDRELGEAAVITGIVLVLRGVIFLSFDLGTVAAAILVLLAAKERGILRGTVAGVLCGLCLDPLYAPAFGAAGFFCGVMLKAGLLPAFGAGVAAGGGYAVAVGGFPALRGIVPDMIVGAVLCYPLARFPPLFRREKETEEQDNRTVSDPSGERLRRTAETFGGLAASFYALSSKLRRPAAKEMNRVLSDVYGAHCAQCDRRDGCWGTDGKRREATRGLLLETMESGGAPDASTVPEYIRKRCGALHDMLDEVNGRMAALHRRKVREDKTELFAANYESISKLLLESLADSAAQTTTDPALSKQVKRALEVMHFHCDSLCVTGSRRRIVTADGVDIRRAGLSSEKIRRVLDNVTGMRYGDPVYSIDGPRISMRAEPVPRFCCTVGKIQIPAVSGEACGDSAVTFDGEDGLFFAALCDGMGTGTEASAASGLSALFLERMLGAGCGAEVSLEMLNTLLRGRGGECSATVDLLRIDRLLGNAEFIKSGAAPSFVVREGHVFRIASDTAPMGILRGVNAQKTSFSLQWGDVILLLSDGAVADEREEGRVIEWLEGGVGEDLSAEGARLLQWLREQSDRQRQDDCSVLLIRVK